MSHNTSQFKFQNRIFKRISAQKAHILKYISPPIRKASEPWRRYIGWASGTQPVFMEAAAPFSVVGRVSATRSMINEVVSIRVG